MGVSEIASKILLRRAAEADLAVRFESILAIDDELSATNGQ